ncbi:MAG: Sec-independent protein translocase TatB [Burkholderiales bacterium 66-5]|uniref:Sec-independent protein translocase protein TatB n=1 Tax=Comamonas badia TaxID=265291 RepID=UPI00040F68D0|nr:Sec-independent protein translocase protein TatB [Comamonas badia]OJU86598.1 MAG: Sec-independent protein translocase TatB [Burkholderiales bacterium 66-5]
MLDIGLSKMALIGVVALVVIGPEKLPRVARTVGTLLGKAQRYVADVKAEVNRSMELDELRKMKDTVENAARDVEKSVATTASDFEKDWKDATAGLADSSADPLPDDPAALALVVPAYKRPDKHWRARRGAVPHWYKARTGMRARVQSGAARVARFRPPKPY